MPGTFHICLLPWCLGLPHCGLPVVGSILPKVGSTLGVTWDFILGVCLFLFITSPICMIVYIISL